MQRRRLRCSYRLFCAFLARSRIAQKALACVPNTVTASDSRPDALAEQAALRRAVDAALSQIRPEYREVVVLRYREDLSIQEIADTMSVPVGTVKIYLYRARKEIASILSAQGWTPASTGEG
jgi:RNA polymerase sigma factor (sigma-70 family)